MAVSVNDRYIRTVSSAAQTVFTYDFPIFTASDITVLHTDVGTWVTTTLIYSTDYTLTGVGNDAGGTFVLNVAAAANDIYTAYGSTPYARATDFTGATSVTTDAINTDYNEEEKQIQQVARDIGRCMRIPLEDNIVTATTELPIATDRANMYPFFDSSGNLTVASGTTGPAGAGGSDTEIQYNNAGVLDGDSGFTTNGSGSVNIVGDLDIDNININGNTISSTDTDGDVYITPNGTGNLNLSTSTEAMKLPSGTTAQRPASPEAGFFRYNTTENVSETYDGSSWITQSGGNGDVSGPGASTDNAIARFNSTGGTLIQNSGVIIDDSDNVTGVNSIQLTETKTIIDANGDKILAFNAAGSSANYVASGNAPTGSAPGFITMGTDTNAGMYLTTKGAGVLTITANAVGINNGSSGPGELRVLETDTNGTNYVGFKAPASISSNVVWTLPSADGTLNQALVTDASGTLSFRKGIAHAFANFSGAGTVSIRNSFNVTTLTDVGVGKYTLTLTNAVSGASAATIASNAQDAIAYGDRQASAWQSSTTVIGVNTGQTATVNLYDSTYVDVVVYDAG